MSKLYVFIYNILYKFKPISINELIKFHNIIEICNLGERSKTLYPHFSIFQKSTLVILEKSIELLPFMLFSLSILGTLTTICLNIFFVLKIVFRHK